PTQLGPAQPVVIYYGNFPNAVVAAVASGRTFVGHNCFGFDRFVWQELIAPLIAPLGGGSPPWADTLPLARAGGFPGKLDDLGKLFAGHGKDTGGRILKQFIHAKEIKEDLPGGGVYKWTKYLYPAPGQLEAILRYNVGDVDLLRRVWEALER